MSSIDWPGVLRSCVPEALFREVLGFSEAFGHDWSGCERASAGVSVMETKSDGSYLFLKPRNRTYLTMITEVL